MFGLAPRTRFMRIETRARNALALLPDAGGAQPRGRAIAAGEPHALAMPAPARRLLAAARAAGVPAALSRDAGRYLCNYLCWQAAERPPAKRPAHRRLRACAAPPAASRHGAAKSAVSRWTI